jgi:parvulin-like peptidyl-prolyl isomerase
MTRQEARITRTSIWKRRLLFWGSPAAIIAAAVAFKSLQSQPEAEAAGPSPIPTKQSAAPGQVNPGQGKSLTAPGAMAADPNAKIVANINGEEISRDDLARECMTRFGKPVIESLINKSLITQQCAANKIQVGDQEVRKEIDQLARKFGMSYEDYLKMLKTERGINAEQYANEIIWPMLALRSLAAKEITPTAEEISQAYEAKYGESVKVRIIVHPDAAKARELQAAAAANPKEFGTLASQHSQDPSASMNGLIQPIRRYIGDKQIEQAAFALTQDAVSQVISLQMPGAQPGSPGAQQFAILKCEGRLPAQNIPPAQREQLEKTLRDSIVEKKLQKEATRIFSEIEKQAKDASAIVNVFNDPKMRAQYPGVAAGVYQQQITIAHLSEECVKRHGTEVLDSVIYRRLLGQALKERNLTVSDDDLETEIAHAAILMGKVDQNGKPDRKAWLHMVTVENGMNWTAYLEDSVWPSAALKKLCGQPEVTNEDLRKGFEANYGARVRARAIVCNNLRKAQEVWEMARTNPTVEEFGKLAEQYSIEASSRALKGQVPPIQRHGGQPLIEAAAYELKPGQISGIVGIGGESYVILFCEGYTEPHKVSFEEVRQSLEEDVFEKKQRIAMAKAFEELKVKARIDNFLAGTMQTPNRKVDYKTSVDSAMQPNGRTGK